MNLLLYLCTNIHKSYRVSQGISGRNRKVADLQLFQKRAERECRVNNLTVYGFELLDNNFWLLSLVLCSLSLSIISMSPLNVDDTKDRSTTDFILTRIRRVLLLTVVLIVALPFLLQGSVCANLVAVTASCSDVSAYTSGKIKGALIPTTSAFILGKLLVFLYSRYVLTYVSHFTRSIRFKIADERLSDIRDVAGKITPKDFIPSKHYALNKNKIFRISQNFLHF